MKIRIILILVTVLLYASKISAQITIESVYRPYTYEEYLAPLLRLEQAYNETMNAIDALTEYIMDILNQNIDAQMRTEMNVLFNEILNISENLEKTGDFNNARKGYNRIKNSVRQKVVNYNNRITQARQNAMQEQNRSPDSKQSVPWSQPSNWAGSGFALYNGYICTNYHVIDGAKSIEIHGIQGDFTTSYSAKVVASDKFNDLAILKVNDADFTGFGSIPYKVKTSMSEVGEDIFVLGYPLTTTMGDEIKLTTGIVSSRTGYQGDVSLYQISAPIQPGNSGGPLFDNQGNLIGIVSAKHTGAENVGYAIKASYLKNLMESSLGEGILPINNTVSSLPLPGKVKKLKNFVYFIKCSSVMATPSYSSRNKKTTQPSYQSKKPNSPSISIKVGEQTTLSVDTNKIVRWESDMPNVATITKEGIVKGISPGTAYIWAHIENEIKLFYVYVEE